MVNAVAEITSDAQMLAAAAKKLIEMGGDVPRRLGNHLEGLFDRGSLSKEGEGVRSTVTRHLGFLDSELVARCVERSTFDPAILLKGGVTLFLQIGAEHLEGQKGLVR